MTNAVNEVTSVKGEVELLSCGTGLMRATSTACDGKAHAGLAGDSRAHSTCDYCTC